MKKVLLILSFIQIAFSSGAQTLDSTMSYCFGKENIITQFNSWSRPRIFDFDKDGDMDFAVLEFNYDSLAVYLNDGSGDFTVTPAYKIKTNSSQVDFAVADLDGDSYMDIVSISDVGNLDFFQNNSGTSYSLVNTIANTVFPNIKCHFIEIHDLNNDGKLDVIGSGQDIVSNTFLTFTWQKTGTGGFNYNMLTTLNVFAGHIAQFNLPKTHFALADFDADGYTDFVIGGDDLTDTLEIYKNAGTTAAIAFLPAVTYTNPVGGYTKFVKAKDCNSDGMPDIEVTSSGGFSINKNLASALTFNPMFTNSSCFGEQFDILDLNSDTKTDLITVDGSGGYYIYTGSSAVSTSPATNYNTFSIYEASRFGFADFDGNGIPDLLGVGGGDFPAIHISRNFSFHIENIITSTNTVICGPTPVNFSVTNTSTYPGIYSWTPGPALGTSYTAISAGGVSCAFSYTLPPGLGQCTLYTDTIFVNAPSVPTAVLNASVSAVICAGSPVSINASVVPASATYTWSTGASSLSIVVNPTVTTTYTLFMDDGCTSMATYTVNITPNPTVNITAPTTSICTGNSLTLTGNGATSYTWYPSTSNTSTISVNPSSTSVYTLIGADASGCSDTTSSTITVSTPPTINIFSSKPLICFPDTVTLNASGASTYTWSTGANTSSITVLVFGNGNYSVTGSNGCISTKNFSLTGLPRPNITITPSKSSLCVGDSVTMQAFGAASYTWSTIQFTSSIFAFPVSSTTYSVLGLGANGCYNYATVPISVGTGSNVSIIASEPELCIGKPVLISAIGANTYTWNTGINNPSFNVTPSNNTPLSYSVAATDLNGCKSTASQFFAISDKCHLIIYNGLSPNGDGHNDFFFIGNIEQYPGCIVTIYNRWGQQLAEIKDYNNTNNFWSGSTGADASKTVPSGTYYYIIDLNNNTGLLKGFLELTKKDFN